MQYLLMIYSEESRWSQMTDSERQQGVAAYQAYTESLKKAEVLAGANRLQHTNTATTVRLVDARPQVLDGPFFRFEGATGGLLPDRCAQSGRRNRMGVTLSRRGAWRH